MKAAIDEGVPAPVLTPPCTALQLPRRGRLRRHVLSAMRKEFGGHDEKAAPPGDARSTRSLTAPFAAPASIEGTFARRA